MSGHSEIEKILVHKHAMLIPTTLPQETPSINPEIPHDMYPLEQTMNNYTNILMGVSKVHDEKVWTQVGQLLTYIQWNL